MDYLTRRSVAAQGIRGVLLRGRSNWPRLSGLGVGVEREETVSRREISTALEDIGITVELPAGDRIGASVIEALLADKEPNYLKQRIESFLDSLSRNARHDLHATTQMECGPIAELLQETKADDEAQRPKVDATQPLPETKTEDGETQGPSEFARSVASALEAAREEAGRIARLHGTPLWCCSKEGECVAVWPVAGTPGQIFPGGLGAYCFVPCSCLEEGVVDEFAYAQSGWASRNVRLNVNSIDSGVFPEKGNPPLQPEAIPEAFIRQLYRETWEPVDHHGRKGKE